MSDDIKKDEETVESVADAIESSVADDVTQTADTVKAETETGTEAAEAETVASEATEPDEAAQEIIAEGFEEIEPEPEVEEVIAEATETEPEVEEVIAEATEPEPEVEEVIAEAQQPEEDVTFAQAQPENDTSASWAGPESETAEPDLEYPVKTKKKSKAKHLAWIIPLAAAGVAAGVIVGGAQNNKDKFWNDTYFGDMYVGGKTVAEVMDALKSDNKELKLTTREGNIESISLDDINYQSSFSTDIQAIKDSQSPYAWFLHNSGENVYDVDINTSYDEKALEDKLAGLDCIISDSIQDPTDAHLALVGDSFTIVEATEGNRIDSEKLNSVIAQSVKSGVFDVNLSDAQVYVAPNVYGNDADLNTTLNNINALKGNKVKLNLHDAEETIDYNIFKDWISTEGTQPVLDDDQIIEYLSGVADKYDTFQTERDFEATGLGTIKVGGGAQDTYGFLLDKEETKDAIKDAILSGKSDTVDAYWTVPANHRNQSNGDIGNTYVEIDISRQHMWYYINGELFTDTDVRTGTESSKQWTPTTEGVYRVLWKQRDKWFLQVGDPCHSDYWMPFNNRGEGIHDATWYSTYGGNLYKWAGSHGCINTPYSIAKLIYENIEAGTPVIVYRS